MCHFKSIFWPDFKYGKTWNLLLPVNAIDQCYITNCIRIVSFRFPIFSWPPISKWSDIDQFWRLITKEYLRENPKKEKSEKSKLLHEKATFLYSFFFALIFRFSVLIFRSFAFSTSTIQWKCSQWWYLHKTSLEILTSKLVY